VDLISDKLCAIEVRAGTLASAEATAFIVRGNDKSKSNPTQLSSGKSAKRGAERAKQKFSCNKCKALHHCAAVSAKEAVCT